MTAFFTLIAHGVSTTVPIAGGGVTPAGGTVPTTAMVTAPVAEANGSAPVAEVDGSTPFTEADGSVPTTATVTAPVAEADGSVPSSWRSGLGGEVGGLQKDNVSVQQY
jgi:hypothetical protein